MDGWQKRSEETWRSDGEAYSGNIPLEFFARPMNKHGKCLVKPPKRQGCFACDWKPICDALFQKMLDHIAYNRRTRGWHYSWEKEEKNRTCPQETADKVIEA